MAGRIEHDQIAIRRRLSRGPHGSELEGLGLCLAQVLDGKIKVHLLGKAAVGP